MITFTIIIEDSPGGYCSINLKSPPNTQCTQTEADTATKLVKGISDVIKLMSGGKAVEQNQGGN